MTNELREQLIKVEAVVQTTKPILARHEYTTANPRTPLTIGLIDQMIEHHEAMLVLVSKRMIGSAFALARSVVEGMYRGMWILCCATDAQVANFQKNDGIDLSMAELASAIDITYEAADFFKGFKQQSWKVLCSYSHMGMLPLGRRFNGHELRPSYTDGEISEIAVTLTTCLLLLILSFLRAQEHPAECQEIEKLLESYGPALSVKQTV